MKTDILNLPSTTGAWIRRNTVGTPLIALLYLGAITAAELVTTALVLVSTNPAWGLSGLVFHILILMALLYHASMSTSPANRRLYLGLACAPLIRIFSLTLPLPTFSTRLQSVFPQVATEPGQIFWYAVAAVPMIGSALLVVGKLNLRFSEIGLKRGRLLPQLLVGLTGIPFGLAEYYILKPPAPLVPPSALAIGTGALILLIGTGFAEEFYFRGIMQKLAGQAIGAWGWIYVAILFAVLHIGYLSVVDVLFVFVVGLFFGWVVRRTGSISGVTVAHGLANTFLYVVIPLLI